MECNNYNFNDAREKIQKLEAVVEQLQAQMQQLNSAIVQIKETLSQTEQPQIRLSDQSKPILPVYTNPLKCDSCGCTPATIMRTQRGTLCAKCYSNGKSATVEC